MGSMYETKTATLPVPSADGRKICNFVDEMIKLFANEPEACGGRRWASLQVNVVVQVPVLLAWSRRRHRHGAGDGLTGGDVGEVHWPGAVHPAHQLEWPILKEIIATYLGCTNSYQVLRISAESKVLRKYIDGAHNSMKLNTCHLFIWLAKRVLIYQLKGIIFNSRPEEVIFRLKIKRWKLKEKRQNKNELTSGANWYPALQS